MKNHDINALAERIRSFREQNEASGETDDRSKHQASWRKGREWALSTSDVARLETLSKSRQSHLGAYPGQAWDRQVERLWRNRITKTVDRAFAESAADAFDEAMASLA